MNTLFQQLEELMQDCASVDEQDQVEFVRKSMSAILAEYTLNPTGDEPEQLLNDQELEKITLNANASASFITELNKFTTALNLLNNSSDVLQSDAREEMADEISWLSSNGFLHKQLIEKFRTPANREFLDMGLHNAECIWHIAMIANWVLNKDGIDRFKKSSWGKSCSAIELPALIKALLDKITFQHISSLRSYRKDAMHHYPKLSVQEFNILKTEGWQDVIDFPSGRKANQDIPLITSFIKQGDIEHSLYRHYLMPDLLNFMRENTPEYCNKMDLNNSDRNLALSLPIVIQQIEEELFAHVKDIVTEQINTWAQKCKAGAVNEVSDALLIMHKIWNYKRSSAAQKCNNPVENIAKGFTASIRNAFNHFSAVNLSASCGSHMDPLDVSEKFILFASVSNGQLNNLANAHQRYSKSLPDPADWDNENFFQHFLTVNKINDPQHIQPHFVIDKTRGCPAVPQIARFHELILDLILDFVLKEFGEDNLRNAGDWFIKEKVQN
ncbi:MAG: hypothetical protein P8M72_02885 [Gammaproteobacteria bacterium]|nr:hypothetical protein [Gammaproteobacteria bacterium]